MRAPAPVSLVRSARLRRYSPEEIVDKYSLETRRAFAAARAAGDAATHVVIPAHNERKDLPATLVAVGRNANACPVVVTNRCDDDTAVLADRMGAIVVDQPTGKKMAATKTGVAFVQGEGHRNMVATDGDTLPGPRWVQAVRHRLETTDQGYGSVVFGSSFAWHGPSKGADVLMSASRVAGVVRRNMQHQPPLANGHNYGVRFDPDGLITDALSGLDDELFIQPGQPADDTQIQQVLLEQTHATVSGIATLESRVITRGDRVGTVRDALRIVVGREVYSDVAEGSYSAQYGVNDACGPAGAPPHDPSAGC